VSPFDTLLFCFPHSLFIRLDSLFIALCQSCKIVGWMEHNIYSLFCVDTLYFVLCINPIAFFCELLSLMLHTLHWSISVSLLACFYSPKLFTLSFYFFLFFPFLTVYRRLYVCYTLFYLFLPCQ